MSASRPPAELRFRAASERDQPAVDGFACSRGLLHETEVQDFIRHSALRFALTPARRYSLLVVHERERLVAVAGYHPELLVVPSEEHGRAVEATRLHVLALSLQDQGKRLSDGHRLSDIVMSTLMDRALGERKTAILTAIVARENLKSLALCDRNGLTSQVAYDHRHLRVSGRFARRT